MADIRIKDLTTTAAASSADDYIAVDGTSNGTRKLSAATPSFATSVTVPDVVGPTSTALTLTGGSSGASLVLGQGTTAGAFTLTPTGTGSLTVNLSGSGSLTNSTWNSGGAAGIGFDYKRTTATATLGGGLASINAYNGTTRAAILEFNGDAATDSGRFDWWVKPTGGGLTQVMTLKSTGNLLIGTTTDRGAKLQAANGAAAGSSVPATFGLISSGTDGANIIAAADGNMTVTMNARSTQGYGSINTYNYGTSAAFPLVVQGNGGNLLIGTTTDMSGVAGGLKIASTAASTGAGFGALQVAGGIYAGAASVFGSTVTAGGVTTLAANSVLAVKAAVGTAAVYVSDSATATPGTTSPGVYFASSTRGGYYRNASGVLQLIDESAPGAGDGSVRTSVNLSTGAATFAGAVTIGGTVIHTLSATPASASATGTVGTMSWDANYIYICTAANTWKRVAIATW